MKGVLRAFRSYISLQPLDLKSFTALSYCYFSAGIHRLTSHNFLTVGGYLRSDVRVKTREGIVCYARKNSEDLGYYARTAKPYTSKWFRPIRGEIVADCGASVGIFSLLAATRGAKVFSFEPNPETFSILKRNIEANGLSKAVIPFNLGLSDKEGELELVVPGTFTGTSSFEENWNEELRKRTGVKYLVRTKTLDSLLEEEKEIDWLLIDVESHEHKLLMGAVKSLKKTKNIIIEVSHNNREVVLNMIIDSGFRIVDKGEPDSQTQYYLFQHKVNS
ncbi:MAG: FkbM family methyltransferase [Candidatus Parvarchaeota archaeon]